MGLKETVEEAEKENLRFFETLPVNDRSRVDFSTVRGVQFLEPLFEFPGACAGCGETPYIKLLSQLFGDRLLTANATGCSSIYGGNLPTTPWTVNIEGRGPAWSNSLFEDNAEFGFGMLAADQLLGEASRLLGCFKDDVGGDLVDEIMTADQQTETQIRHQRERVAELKRRLVALESEPAKQLLSVADHFVRRSVWIIGGDGWAYDIGSGGVDHVLASGRDVNILVLIPRSTPTPADRRPRLLEAPSPSSPTPASTWVRRTWRCRRSLRQRLRRPRRHGSQRAADAARLPRGRSLQGAVLDPCLQPLHSTRHQDAARPETAALCRPQRTLAP